MSEKDYALEWYKYGLEKGDDAIVKFMMHWIAFNWLYSESRSDSETDNIKTYCENNIDKLTRYNAFGTGAYLIFEDGPVIDEKHARPKRGLYRGLHSDSELESVTSLILTIYQVRCNLFHGSKRLYIDRDRELVRSSAIIMEGYLKALLLDDPTF